MTAPKTAILAHGKNWEIPIPHDPHDIELSIESKMTAEAAGTLLSQGIGDLVIFSGGHTAGPRFPSEAEKMMETMYANFTEAQIAPARVKLEQASRDTVSNLREVKERLPGLEVDNIILLTVGYHLPRAKRLARLLGVPVSAAFKSDYVIRGRHGGQNHLYGRTVMRQAIDGQNTKPLLRTASAYGLEAAGWGAALVDPRGLHLAKLATSKLRQQN